MKTNDQISEAIQKSAEKAWRRFFRAYEKEWLEACKEGPLELMSAGSMLALDRYFEAFVKQKLKIMRKQNRTMAITLLATRKAAI